MKTILKILTNKYLLAGVVFLLMIGFFSPYDLFTIRDNQKELEEITGKIEYLNSESDRIDLELQRLKENPETLEKYARELYHEKKPGEDVYIIHSK